MNIHHVLCDPYLVSFPFYTIPICLFLKIHRIFYLLVIYNAHGALKEINKNTTIASYKDKNLNDYSKNNFAVSLGVWQCLGCSMKPLHFFSSSKIFVTKCIEVMRFFSFKTFHWVIFISVSFCHLLELS